MKQTNYGNWIPAPLMRTLLGCTAVFFAVWAVCAFFWKNRPASIAAFLLFLAAAAMTGYMQVCRQAFSFEGGNIMGRIHRFLLEKLRFSGEGTILDIGCGSGALSILCARTWPGAKITGIDFWGKEWSYAKEQCEENARIEQVSPIRFQQGDAAALPFADGSFDAAVSNFVFHEVKSQPDKRKVVREALRVVKKGGSFAFHDLFSQPAIYGDMEEFCQELRREGISEIHYEAHTERLPFIPGYVKAPWLLSGLGVIYGIK